MSVRMVVVLSLFFLGCLSSALGLCAQEQNWTNFVRIGAYGLRADNAER